MPPKTCSAPELAAAVRVLTGVLHLSRDELALEHFADVCAPLPYILLMLRPQLLVTGQSLQSVPVRVYHEYPEPSYCALSRPLPAGTARQTHLVELRTSPGEQELAPVLSPQADMAAGLHAECR